MEIDTSGSVGVDGRGVSEEYLLPSLTPEHTPTHTPQQGAIQPPISGILCGQSARSSVPIWAACSASLLHTCC